MSLAAFRNDPWKNSHRAYRESALSISPAPEYASSEVLVASLYRTIGFAAASEGGVPQAGRELDREIQKRRQKGLPSPDGATLDPGTWNTMLHGILESPKLPNQSTRRFIQVTPLVPRMTLFSNSPRLTGNPWKAGALIRGMVVLGTKDEEAAQALWADLFSALTIEDSDDVFARWLDQEAAAWTKSVDWKLVVIPAGETGRLAEADYQNIKFLPARQFTKDLRAIIESKGSVTRRQWTSLLEALLRLGAAIHVVWLCDVQERIWKCIKDALQGDGPHGNEEARAAVFPAEAQYMSHGVKALNGLKDRASSYLTARLGINAVLWALEEAGIATKDDISSSQGIATFCQSIRENRDNLAALGTMESFQDIRETEARALTCEKGIGKNLLEFERHVLGQRQTALQLLRGYDQGYILRKSGSSASSPWIVSLGPVAVLALVHCALHGMGGPRSIHRLAEHLAAYGVALNRHDIAKNDLGHQLRMLGLVLDSPDAESGMLLLPPFAVNHRPSA
jgi:hypothetical protein